MAHARVVGGGLAGCEAAYQLALRGHEVRLVEMRPHRRSPAHHSDDLAELVCSNSLRAAAPTNAVGLLKEELRRADSLIMRCADATQVPAGGALAVDRSRFAAMVTAEIEGASRITVERAELRELPSERPLVLATGPLTSDALAADLAKRLGREHLAYYDAIAPIIAADSIDRSIVWAQSRYDKGDAAYLNCPLDETQYHDFVAALLEADAVVARSFEHARHFEGCLPCEVIAGRGPQTLAFGPLKPVGLTDPRTGKRPYAVVQLRPEDEACTAYNLVGMQTRLTHSAQRRVLRTIPGLESADFLRLGAVHRNTFIDAPRVLDRTMQLEREPGVYVAGQLSGMEGYVESTAGGLLCGMLLSQRLADQAVTLPPATTALGGLLGHLSRTDREYQPSNITWAHLPPLEGPGRRLRKRARYEKVAERARADLGPWLEQHAVA